MKFRSRLMSRTETVTLTRAQMELIRRYLLAYMQTKAHPKMSGRLIKQFTRLYLRVTRMSGHLSAKVKLNIADCAFIANLNHRYWEQHKTNLLAVPDSKGRKVIRSVADLSRKATNTFVDLCPSVPLGIRFWKEYIIRAI